MNQFLAGTVILAALLFIAVSAAMNALFLASLGRTEIEAGLLVAVSLGSDMVKAVLPVLLLRAMVIRAWGQAFAAALMLMVVVALSLASGTGFAALTRGAATAAREAQAEALASRRRDFRDIDARIALVPVPRSASIIEADLASTRIDRRWQGSKACTEPSTSAARTFCGDVLKLQAELAAAREHDRLAADRRELRGVIERLETQRGAGESDPQASAIAELLGVDRRWPRVVLTSSIALILELGSVLLVLLAAGPTVRGWRDPGSPPVTEPVAAALPIQADRMHWRRQRGNDILGLAARDGEHGAGR